MNFKKLLIVVAAVVVVISVYKFLTRIDRSNPLAVATAFTKAMNKNDMSTASGFYLPAGADAWREKTDEKVSSLRSGAKERYFERIPDAPTFGPMATVAGKQTLAAAEEGFTLEMSNLDGKWYVARTSMD